ncbi:uncharacterized protein conserved in bacteria [Zymobacter palmae]|uniref:Uncharacterized protein conserved in bacteria n=1 Tax=Zymobacter palmae TaxID=33074 RepID=A0A348HF64_9GAMM|nr:uncharacterized protein conserved in bacteria [Zymobacter palmae]
MPKNGCAMPPIFGTESHPFCSQVFAHFHKNRAEHVFARAITTISPIGIFGRVLYQQTISRAEQQRAGFFMLRELLQHSMAHHFILDAFPVLSQRQLAVAADFCCFTCLEAALNLSLDSRIKKLLCLEIVFDCPPARFAFPKAITVKV